jgi:error-prone DNA polymerase
VSSNYTELHAHSCWSLLEGASQTDELVLRAAELGYDALALTDHDGLYGAMEFAHKATLQTAAKITQPTLLDFLR